MHWATGENPSNKEERKDIKRYAESNFPIFTPNLRNDPKPFPDGHAYISLHASETSQKKFKEWGTTGAGKRIN